MFKHLLENAGNINWMAIFALVTFFLMFIIAAVTILSRKQDYLDHMSNLPLEDNQPNHL